MNKELLQAIRDIQTVLKVEGLDLETGSRKLLKEAIAALQSAVAKPTKEWSDENVIAWCIDRGVVSAKTDVPVAWWVPKAEQFCLQDKDGSRPFANAWEPLYASQPNAQPARPMPDIEMALRVASEYGTKDSQIDSGNLYAALRQCLEQMALRS